MPVRRLNVRLCLSVAAWDKVMNLDRFDLA